MPEEKKINLREVLQHARALLNALEDAGIVDEQKILVVGCLWTIFKHSDKIQDNKTAIVQMKEKLHHLMPARHVDSGAWLDEVISYLQDEVP